MSGNSLVGRLGITSTVVGGLVMAATAVGGNSSASVGDMYDIASQATATIERSGPRMVFSPMHITPGNVYDENTGIRTDYHADGSISEYHSDLGIYAFSNTQTIYGCPSDN